MGLVLFTSDSGAEGVETLVYILITSIDLVNVAYHACALCRHSCNEKSDTSTDIW